MNGIGLYWEMEGEGDECWYEEMGCGLGGKRSGEEMDGEFVCWGNRVFDMGDMKGMEDWLSDYGVLKYGLNGEYRELKEGDGNKE